MTQILLTLVVLAEIAGLFYLDRDTRVRPSPALWIPVVWMLIVGSREISEWMSLRNRTTVASKFTEGNLSDALGFAFLMVLGFLVLNFRPRQVAGVLQRNLPLFLFLFYCLFSVLWSDFPVVAIKRWVKAIGTLMMVLIILTDPHPRVAIRQFFSRISFLLLPLSVLFIEGFPDLGSTYDPVERVTYYVGVMTQKNELGVVSLICGLGSLGSFLGALGIRNRHERMRKLIAHGILIATAFWLLKKSDSMTSLSSLVIAGAVMVLIYRRITQFRATYVHAVVGTALVLAVFATFLDESGALLRLVGRTATLTGRTEIWKAVLSFHTNQLFGTGYDSFWLGSRINKVWEIIGYKGIAEAHNGYLEIYINLGWMGLALLTGVVLNGYRDAIHMHRTDPLGASLRLALITAALMYSLTEAGFRMMTPMWIALLMQVTWAPRGLELQKPQPHPALRRAQVDGRRPRQIIL
jgi:O-antigen ligase